MKTNAPVECPQTREEMWGVISKATGMGRREVARKWRRMEKTREGIEVCPVDE